jgi:hypothetical protein
MYRYFRFFFVFITFSWVAASFVSAQDRYNFFYGKVLDQETRKPLENVNLSVSASNVGTVTSKNGSFSFYIDTIPARLVVSYVGYITKYILLDATSFSLTVYLSPALSELPEVEIRANAHEAFFKDEHYAVLDYELDSGMVYLLIYKRYLSRSELICKSIYGDTVAMSQPFYFKPERLFRDCLGFMHVLSHDSGFQVFRQGKEMQLIHPVNLKKFDDVLKNCVAATQEVLYFQHVTDRGQGVEYFGVNRKTLEKNPIAMVRDEKKLKMLRRNEGDAMLLQSTVLPDSRDDFVAWNYVHKILYRPIKTSLFRIGEFTCIFNTPEKQMEFYDREGSFSYKLAIRADDVDDGRWTCDLVVDEQSGKIYTLYVRNGTFNIYEIDVNSGALKKRLSLFHPYPRKVRIFNSFVYYLYDVAGDPDNKMLYRQKL